MRYALCSLVLLAVPSVRAADPTPDFNRDVRPILADKCYHCHGPDSMNRKGGLRLDTPSGAARVLRGDKPAETELIRRITTTDAEERMPPEESNFTKRLTAKETATLQAWVAGGGKYASHWAFATPVSPALPANPNPTWQAPIDRLIFAKMLQEKLKPSPRADKATLIRRVTLDLTGLPPTAEEVSAFVNDTSLNAYEKVVDRLLSSPRFGERMAVWWLDLARYGDSSVYHADGPREMWGWRDWVIQSFNANKRFDAFTVEQLAGDLIPNATTDQKIATGFNRNHATTDEGGVIPEEFRVDYVVDRVKTVSSTWLGLSLECGQCHDHKYDPITQREYYQFYAYFNNTRDAGMQTRQGNATPLVELKDPDGEKKKLAAKEAREEVVRQLLDQRTKAVKAKPFTEWLAKQTAPKGATPPSQELRFYLPCDEKERATTLVDLFGTVGAATAGRGQDAKRESGDGLKLPGNAVYQFAGDPKLEHNTPFTFAAWMKVPANGGGFLLTKMDSPEKDYRGYDLGLDARKPGLHLIHRWSENALKVYAKNPIKPDQWQHVVISYDGSGKAAGVRIFVDGVAQETAVHADTLSKSIANDEPLRLGSRTDGGQFNGEIDDVAIYNGAVKPEEVAALAGDPVQRLLAIPAEKRTAAQTELLATHFLRTTDTGYQNRLRSLAQKFNDERKLERGMSSVMVMEDLPPNQMRPTFVLNRGQYDQPKKDTAVKPGVPAIFPPLPSDAPANRLGLARWLVQADHPLTTRVTVNRFWQLFFGEGLVRTMEDFGIQGETPSHPELLDWLAVDFVQHGWDVKRTLKQMVMSSTYCQNSRITPELRERDPENRLLARGPRFRLQAEFIRDSALFVSGLFVEKIGGPSVRPYQPPGIWEEVAIDTGLSRFVQDTGEKLYRRSLYTYWKRSSPHPSMMTFDAPTREKCTGSRSRTNTPLQALVTLNDTQFVEAARVFAERIIKQGGGSNEERVKFAIRAALGRPATEKEIELLAKLATAQTARFRDDAKSAAAFLKIGESPRDEKIPAADHAAWSVVASTILNLDEFLMKN